MTVGECVYRHRSYEKKLLWRRRGQMPAAQTTSATEPKNRGHPTHLSRQVLSGRVPNEGPDGGVGAAEAAGLGWGASSLLDSTGGNRTPPKKGGGLGGLDLPQVARQGSCVGSLALAQRKHFFPVWGAGVLRQNRSGTGRKKISGCSLPKGPSAITGRRSVQFPKKEKKTTESADN